jgi:hypothetical protein
MLDNKNLYLIGILLFFIKELLITAGFE